MDKRMITYMLTVEDIGRIKREGIERDELRNETFCRLLGSLGFRFYKTGNRIGGFKNYNSHESGVFSSEDEYIDWLEKMRKELKPWVDNLVKSILDANRNIVFLIDERGMDYTKLYNATSENQWDASSEKSLEIIQEICEDHKHELSRGCWICIADKQKDVYKPRYRAWQVAELKSRVIYEVEEIGEYHKDIFDSIVNKK